MALSTLILALFIFLQAAAYLGWFVVSPTVFGLVGLAFVIVIVLEAIAARSVSFPRLGR